MKTFSVQVWPGSDLAVGRELVELLRSQGAEEAPPEVREGPGPLSQVAMTTGFVMDLLPKSKVGQCCYNDGMTKTLYSYTKYYDKCL